MSPLRYLLAFLFAFLRPGIGEGEEPDFDLGEEPPGDDPAPADPAPNDDTPDPPGVDHAALYAEEKAARQSERERADRLEREMGELRAAQNLNRGVDPALAEEDRKLADTTVSDLEKWQIRANRELRAGRTLSENALRQAQDIADKTSFNALATTNAPLFKRYEKRVEEEFQKLRAKGQAAPREAILRFLIGNDALEGKLNTKKPAVAKPDTSNVNRGRLPGARSDLNGRNGQSERDKRRARLENVQI